MAECTIGEYPSGAPNGMQLVRPSYCLARQVLNVGGVSSVTQPFGSNTRSIRVWTDTKMAWRGGAAGVAPPTALVTDEGMTPGQTEYFNVEPGEYFAVILLP